MNLNERAFSRATLLRRYLAGELNPAEVAEMEQWLAAAPENRQLAEKLQHQQQVNQDLKNLSELDVNQAWAQVRARAENRLPATPAWWQRPAWRRLAAAVALLLLALGGLLFLERQPREMQTRAVLQPVRQPSSDQATLTLENGEVLALDALAEGTVRTYPGLKISKHQGRVIYEISSRGAEKGVVGFHTISTPRGGQHELLLPDGSRVWLNASSSLRFPSAFTGRWRQVELKGEGYFEVAPDKQHPFQVVVGNGKVQVLGTRFNVMAYEEEKIVTTTLLEGAVALHRDGKLLELKPGQQGRWEAGHSHLLRGTADLEQALAWKNNLFYFNDAGLQTVMRQLARWYDVEIVYPETVPQVHFNGQLSRSTSLVQVLDLLQRSGGIRLELHGRQVRVNPKRPAETK
ncbi:MAG: FecR domain-containing protein [Adhaeribacter sp.]